MEFEAPSNPAGPLAVDLEFSIDNQQVLIDSLRSAPMKMREATDGLSDKQLETKYRNWTIRQIVHHVGDSHVNSYIRFKWALAEDCPTIKAYEEADWVQLPDAAHGEIETSLALLDGLHQRWTQQLELMTQSDYERAFIHPQSGEKVTLWSALNYYPWHSRHHTGQILWLREKHGF